MHSVCVFLIKDEFKHYTSLFNSVCSCEPLLVFPKYTFKKDFKKELTNDRKQNETDAF